MILRNAKDLRNDNLRLSPDLSQGSPREEISLRVASAAGAIRHTQCGIVVASFLRVTMSQTTYIYLGISPNADAILLQTINPEAERCLPPGYAIFAFTLSLAELDSFGRPDAIGKIGRLTLSAMCIDFPVMSMFADALISPISGRQFVVEVPDHSGARRDLHLRIMVSVCEDKSVLIGRFNKNAPVGGEIAALSVDHLMELGPEGATDFFGATLLEELAALHPDVFAPFPALSG